LGFYENEHWNIEDNWLKIEGILEKTWYESYMISFYWALATMMLIGTRGYNFYETSFTTITVLLTVGVFAFVI
jgi:hypothetical protein